jgi:hypothetical protein
MTDQEIRLQVLSLALAYKKPGLVDTTVTDDRLELAKQWYAWIKEGDNIRPSPFGVAA